MASNPNDETLNNTEEAMSPQNGESAASPQDETAADAVDNTPPQDDGTGDLPQGDAGGAPDINDDIDGPYNGNWDEKKVDIENLIKKFEDNNMSVIDKNPAFWWTIFGLFVVVIGLLVWGIYGFFMHESSEITGNCLQSATFWYFIIQKIGLIVCILFVFFPFLKLFCATIGMINKSQENKSIRMVQALRFCYVLKYLGKIDSELMKSFLGEEEIQEKRKNSEKETGISTKEIANLLKKIEPITKWFVNLVRK